MSIDTDGSAYFPPENSTLYKLHRNLQSTFWSAVGDGNADIGAPGAIDGTGRYLRPMGDADGSLLHIFSASGALLLRDERFPLVTTAPVISEGGDIVFTTKAGLLVCLDGETFDEKWVREGFANQPPLAAGVLPAGAIHGGLDLLLRARRPAERLY